jgi:predicted kinase
MTAKRTIVVSGAPATGKSTVAAAVADRLGFPLLSLDMVKETLADVLGVREEVWSYALGDAAAEVVFRLSAAFPCAVVEGWWRGERRKQAEERFAGCVEVFCHCEPTLAEHRMRMRRSADRHLIHRDMINPDVVREAAQLARTVPALGVGTALIEVDTTSAVAWNAVLGAVRHALDQGVVTSAALAEGNARRRSRGAGVK